MATGRGRGEGKARVRERMTWMTGAAREAKGANGYDSRCLKSPDVKPDARCLQLTNRGTEGLNH